MALSPWKRLTRLMLRRRHADQVQAILADGRAASDDVIGTTDVALANPQFGDAAAAELVPMGAVADELSQLRDGEPAEAVETAAELEAANGPLNEDRSLTADEVPPAEPLLRPPNEDQAKKARRPRRNTAKAASPGQVEHDRVTTAEKLQSSLSDLMEVEEEIRQLRAQLSAKLRIQNAQLKQMLKRFEQA